MRSLTETKGRTLTIPRLPSGGLCRVAAFCVGWILTIPRLPSGGFKKAATTVASISQALTLLAQIERLHTSRAERRENLVVTQKRPCGNCHFFISAVQFVTTVSGAFCSTSINALIRNRCPSRVTA